VRWITAGAVLALIAWIVASAIFALDVANFGPITRPTARSAASPPLDVDHNMAILLGAELNSETERARQIHTGVRRAERSSRSRSVRRHRDGNARTPCDALEKSLKELAMPKSSRRDKAEGTVDKIAGRVLEAFSKLTGNRSAGAKGKAARTRGTGRSAKGRVKRRSGR
jgi:uncharacterized protein YjbJ (UPF0337 family)